MKYLPIFLLLYNYCFSQNTPLYFWEHRCDYKTDGTGKSLNLKIKLSVPCSWTKADGERPHIVKKFTFTESGNTAGINLNINKTDAPLTQNEIDQLISYNELKRIAEKYGTFISARHIKIDGVETGEIIYISKRESTLGTFYQTTIQYFIPFKDKIVLLTYSVGSSDENTAQNLFNNYKTLFKGLAGQTVII